MTAYDDAARLSGHPAFRRLAAAVVARTGLAYWCDRPVELAQALVPVVRRFGEPDRLARLLEAGADGEAVDAAVEAVTVGETFFMRYGEQFAALAGTVLPDRIRRRAQEHCLAVWSAGCSIGAETYSVAMTLYRCCVAPLAGWRLRILGTDIDPAALAVARRGEYGDWALRGVADDLRRDCFHRSGDRWRIEDVYRRGVEFRHHNLVTQPPPSAPCQGGGFDVVLCRNVLMYFSPATRAGVAARLHGALAEGGWLVVGPAEAGPELAALFEPVPLAGCTLFRKPARARRAGPPPPAPGRRHPPPPPPSPRPQPAGMRALLDQGRYAEAATVGSLRVRSAPMDAAAHYHQALALEAQSSDRAAAALERAVYLDPGFSLAHFHLLRLRPREAGRHLHALLASLAGRPDDDAVPMGDGLTVGELRAVATRVAGEARK
ncbi:MAG: protein-glutamate O-methyltransferase CheR [Pseudomonadota bacterium]